MMKYLFSRSIEVAVSSRSDFAKCSHLIQRPQLLVHSSMTLDTDADVVAIREWISKEKYLPQDLETRMIKKFLHSCYGSLEQTKKCIEKYACGRSNMPEVYTSRDPSSKKMETAFSIAYVSTFKAGENEILIHLLDVPTLDKFSYYDVLKTLSVQADHWIREQDFYPEGHIVILDIKYYTLRLVSKVNVFFFQKFLIFLLEGMPVRLKQVHVINCPSYYEKLYMLVKNVLPQEICNMIVFHSSHEGLFSHIDKKFLPVEYDGEAPSMLEQHKEWVKKIQDVRKLYSNDNLWKADMTRKPKKNGEDVMDGSFRTLSID